MARQLVLRGVLVGALGGLFAFLFARVFAEPVIQRAIDYESGRDAAQDALDKAAGLPVYPADPEVFSRAVQANIGIGAGMILFGAAMGTLFAVVYTICIGRTGLLRPRTLALLVAGAGFLALYFVPFVKYPANPPSIGHPDTIKERSGFYLLMVLAAVVLLVVALVLGRRLTSRFGNWTASLIASGGYIVMIGLVMALLPKLGMIGVNVAQYGPRATETPLPLIDPKGAIVYPGFPADDLYSFRFLSVGAQLILWAAIGLLFAPMAERLLNPGRKTVRHREIAAA